MYVLTGFGDEISPELEMQLDTMAGEGLSYLELRGAWGKNVMDFSETDLGKVKSILQKKNFSISAIGSPIGKIKITEDFKSHFEKFKHAVYLAKYFGTPYIRLFSYYPPDGGNINDYRLEVMERMKQKARYAEKENVVLLNENELNLYGENPENCLDILKTVNSKNLKALFDPANFIIEGIKPYDRAYPLLKDHIVYFHIKDGLPKEKAQGKVVCLPAGEGEGQIKEVLKDFAGVSKDRQVFLSLEPHLAAAGQFSGFSGPQLFQKAVQALKKILKEIQ